MFHTHIFSLKRWVLIVSEFYRRGNWGIEKLRISPSHPEGFETGLDLQNPSSLYPTILLHFPYFLLLMSHQMYEILGNWAWKQQLCQYHSISGNSLGCFWWGLVTFRGKEVFGEGEFNLTLQQTSFFFPWRNLFWGTNWSVQDLKCLLSHHIHFGSLSRQNLGSDVLSSQGVNSRGELGGGVSLWVCISALLCSSGKARDLPLSSCCGFVKTHWDSLVQWEVRLNFGNRYIYYYIYVFVYPQKKDEYNVVPDIISNKYI